MSEEKSFCTITVLPYVFSLPSLHIHHSFSDICINNFELELQAKYSMIQQDEALDLTIALAEALGRLVSGSKRARGRVEHLSLCTRAQHRLCRASGPSAHHAVAARAPCAAGLAARALGAGLAACAQPAPARALLRVLLRCGTCCCAGNDTCLFSLTLICIRKWVLSRSFYRQNVIVRPRP